MYFDDNFDYVWLGEVVSDSDISWTETSLTTTIGARYDYNVVFLNQTHEIFLFRGYYGSSSGSDFGDSWLFDLNTSQWAPANLNTTSSSDRHDHSMCADEITDDVYLFGGSHNFDLTNDLWRYDRSIQNWSVIFTNNDPEPREKAHMLCDGPNRRLLMYGGDLNDQGDMEE